VVRTFNVEARSKGRMSIHLRAQIITEPGTLTKDEVSILKTRLADQLMNSLSVMPYLGVGISEIKVTR